MPAFKLLTLALTALILVPSGAHLFEAQHKLAMDRTDYFVVQGIYAGWSLFALPILAAIAANLTLAARMRHLDSFAVRAALASAALIALSLLVFFALVLPANTSTANWTQTVPDWVTFRRNWELGHAIGALLVFGALLCTGRAVIGRDSATSKTHNHPTN